MGMAQYQIGKSVRLLGQFIRLNLRDFQSMNTAMFQRKLRTLIVRHLRNHIVTMALLPFSCLVALVLRLLRPLVIVRIGTINASRIGHLSMDPEMSASEKEIGVWLPRQPVFDIWYVWRGSYPVANQQMLAMWRRSLRVWPAWLWRRIDAASRFLPGGSAHVVPYRKGLKGVPDHLQADAYGAMRRTRPHVAFTNDEIREAQRQLEIAGQDSTARHVCFLVRDSAYLHSTVPGDHSAHDFRDSDIAKFFPAMHWLAEQGVVVFRMGAVVRDALTESHPLIVDYATNGMRSELLDIWLSATCEFFVSTATGIDGVANLFRRKRVLADLGQLTGFSLSFDTLSIPKLLYSESECRPLTLRESVGIGALSFVDTADFTSRKLELRGNTPDEIVAIVREAFERQNDMWLRRPDEDELQARFLDALPDSMKVGGVYGRVGYEFLRDNSWWLD